MDISKNQANSVSDLRDELSAILDAMDTDAL
jgi:hypothetical protein